jgi:hypothetical protein
MTPDPPTLNAVCDALERHIAATEDEEIVLTCALVIWEGAGPGGWLMNYLVVPGGASPATTIGLAHFGMKELEDEYKPDPGQPPDSGCADADGA